VKKLLRIEFIKTIGYGPVKILIPLHILFFLLGFFAIPRIDIDFPFLSVLPLYQFPHVWNFITWVGGFYNLTLVLLIIMLTCLEFTNKTYKHQVIFGLSRDELFFQKIILSLLLSVYVLALTFGTVLASGLIYSYKITFSIIFERSYILFSSFLQTFTWLMTGVLFALIFKNMILSVLVFGFYRVILEPILRNLASDDASWFFPTKFITKLTPEPDVLKIVQEKLQTTDQVSPEELSEYNRIIPEGVPIWQNIILTLIFLSLVLIAIRLIFKSRRLT
jgi:ABC-type transport system involved in multi-copper enzyme maturation permease subunit